MKRKYAPATSWIAILFLLVSICAALTFSQRSFAKSNPQADKVVATEAKTILTTTGIGPGDDSVLGDWVVLGDGVVLGDAVQAMSATIQWRPPGLGEGPQMVAGLRAPAKMKPTHPLLILTLGE